MKTETATRYVGNCQVCEGDQKLHNGLMVHHGFRRPGDGYIHGDCVAVGQEPYEVSCEFLRTVYLPGLNNTVAGIERFLARLKANEVNEINYRKPNYKTGQDDLIKLVRGECDSAEWDRQYRIKIANTESQLRWYQREVSRIEARIAAWVAKPIRTIEEVKAIVDADKAAKRAVRQAARDARAAKIAATKAKQDALEAKRQAIREEFANGFRALAASPENLADRKRAAFVLADKMNLRKYASWIHTCDLGCDDALIALGMATREPRSGGRDFVNYAHPLRW